MKNFLTRFIVIAIIFMAGLVLIVYEPQEQRENIDLSERISDNELNMLPNELATGQQDGDVLRFGFDLRSSPQEDARQYLPFLQYLEETTGYRFELHFSPEGKIVEELGTGVVQFAAIGAVSYIQADSQYNVIPLVHGINVLNEAAYRSMIVVPPDSPIQDVTELRGKRFAFGSYDSTQGHIIPRIALSDYNLTLTDLAGYEYTGSHRNCANAIISEQFDACGLQDTMAQELSATGLVRIIYTSKYYPSSGITANNNVSPEIVAAVREALLDFQPQGRDANGLYNWEKTEMPNGFTEANDEDYAELREWILTFNLLNDSIEGDAP